MNVQLTFIIICYVIFNEYRFCIVAYACMSSARASMQLLLYWAHHNLVVVSTLLLVVFGKVLSVSVQTLLAYNIKVDIFMTHHELTTWNHTLWLYVHIYACLHPLPPPIPVVMYQFNILAGVKKGQPPLPTILYW